MWATVVLGMIFLGVQAYEYMHAYRDLNLKLTSGIFGSTFFMLTGFHGFHVILGATMLTVILIRLLKGHFTPSHHFGFEGAAHFDHLDHGLLRGGQLRLEVQGRKGQLGVDEDPAALA